MATVVKCDQCGKVDSPKSMQAMVLEIGNNNTLNTNGDFCSQECILKYISEKLQKLWYDATRNNY